MMATAAIDPPALQDYHRPEDTIANTQRQKVPQKHPEPHIEAESAKVRQTEQQQQQQQKQTQTQTQLELEPEPQPLADKIPSSIPLSHSLPSLASQPVPHASVLRQRRGVRDQSQHLNHQNNHRSTHEDMTSSSSSYESEDQDININSYRDIPRPIARQYSSSSSHLYSSSIDAKLSANLDGEGHTASGGASILSAPNTVGVTTTMLKDEPVAKKWKNWWIRTLWTVVMIAGFLGILRSGHVFVVLLVVVLQTMVYWEVISIAHVPSKAKKMPWFRTMSWYFLVSTNYFLYGQTIIQYFKQSVFVDAFLTPLASHHTFISFFLYVIGFVAFVCNLQKGHYKFQFSQFAWTHMTLLLVVVQSQSMIKNIFEGLVWFVLPVSLVICNDITAYVSGFFFGKTPLIQLSPKKTWEGFIGALVATLIFAFFFSGAIASSPYMTCPVRDLQTPSSPVCTLNPVFVPIDINLTPAMTSFIRHISLNTYPAVKTLSVYPIQLHSLVMSLFASLIAPFGGFFASGAKRAFKLKDFGDYIPGHGGITDRMDCQFLMSFFAFLYYQSFIARSDLTVGQVLQTIVAGLGPADQAELYNSFREYLLQQGMIDANGVAVLPVPRPLLSVRPRG